MNTTLDAARGDDSKQSPGWGDGFARLTLASAIFGDLIDKLPGAFTASLFGDANSPRQRIARVVEQYVKQYGSRPGSPEIVRDLLDAEMKNRTKAEQDAVNDEWLAVLAVELPDDPRYVEDKLLGWIDFTRLSQSIQDAAGSLDMESPEGLVQAREILAKATSVGSNGLSLEPWNDVLIRNVPWTWPGYIPRGALTLIVGEPEGSKTTYCIDYAARVSRGAAWPDGAAGGKPSSVIFLSTEDSVSYTLKPRFVAMGGDASRIFGLKFVVGQRGFTLDKDVPTLQAMVKTTGAGHVIIDPLNGHLGKVDSWKDDALRAVLGPLAQLAEQMDLVVLAIVHLNKQREYSAIQRVMGSVANIATARAAYIVAKDPTRPSSRRLFAPLKMNIAAAPNSLAFNLDPVSLIDPTSAVPITTIKVVWETAPVIITADEIVRPPKRRPRDEAVEQIMELLKGGPVAVTVMEEKLTAAGISEGTWKNAKKDMNVGSIKDPAPDGVWYWYSSDFNSEKRAAWTERRKKVPGNG